MAELTGKVLKDGRIRGRERPLWRCRWRREARPAVQLTANQSARPGVIICQKGGKRTYFHLQVVGTVLPYMCNSDRFIKEDDMSNVNIQLNW